MATATLHAEPYLAPDPARPPVPVAPPQPLATSLGDVLHSVIERVRTGGSDVFVLDQTRADVPLSVVRIVTPALRHFWRRLGPGRLFDVPERLGLVPPGRTETDLNPWPFFA